MTPVPYRNPTLRLKPPGQWRPDANEIPKPALPPAGWLGEKLSMLMGSFLRFCAARQATQKLEWPKIQDQAKS